MSDFIEIKPSFNNTSIYKVTRELKKEQNSLFNCLNSILHDSAFVEEIHSLYPSLPLFANLRCGLWYTSSPNNSCYFKSTDGHNGNWSFSTTRLNLHVCETAALDGGCIIVDATRKGKRFPDAFTKTVPIWTTVINRAIARVRRQAKSQKLLPDPYDANAQAKSHACAPQAPCTPILPPLHVPSHDPPSLNPAISLVTKSSCSNDGTTKHSDFSFPSTGHTDTICSAQSDPCSGMPRASSLQEWLPHPPSIQSEPLVTQSSPACSTLTLHLSTRLERGHRHRMSTSRRAPTLPSRLNPSSQNQHNSPNSAQLTPSAPITCRRNRTFSVKINRESLTCKNRGTRVLHAIYGIDEEEGLNEEEQHSDEEQVRRGSLFASFSRSCPEQHTSSPMLIGSAMRRSISESTIYESLPSSLDSLPDSVSSLQGSLSSSIECSPPLPGSLTSSFECLPSSQGHLGSCIECLPSLPGPLANCMEGLSLNLEEDTQPPTPKLFLGPKRSEWDGEVWREKRCEDGSMPGKVWVHEPVYAENWAIEVQCDEHSTQHSSHSMQCDKHSMQCDEHSTQHSNHSTQFNKHSMQCDEHSTHSTQYSNHSMQCNEHSTRCDKPSMWHTDQSTQSAQSANESGFSVVLEVGQEAGVDFFENAYKYGDLDWECVRGGKLLGDGCCAASAQLHAQHRQLLLDSRQHDSASSLSASCLSSEANPTTSPTSVSSQFPSHSTTQPSSPSEPHDAAQHIPSSSTSSFHPPSHSTTQPLLPSGPLDATQHTPSSIPSNTSSHPPSHSTAQPLLPSASLNATQHNASTLPCNSSSHPPLHLMTQPSLPPTSVDTTQHAEYDAPEWNTAQAQHAECEVPERDTAQAQHAACEEPEWDTALHLPIWISENERLQIEQRLDGWVDELFKVGVDVQGLAKTLRKPLRPLWISQASNIWVDEVAQPDTLNFTPIILLSASETHSYHRTCCAAAATENEGGRAGGHNWTYVYVPGAGDDEESWAAGLTPQLFWAHYQHLLATGPAGIMDATKALLSRKPTTQHDHNSTAHPTQGVNSARGCTKPIPHTATDEHHQKPKGCGDDDSWGDIRAMLGNGVVAQHGWLVSGMHMLGETGIVLGSFGSGAAPAVWRGIGAVMNVGEVEHGSMGLEVRWEGVEGGEGGVGTGGSGGGMGGGVPKGTRGAGSIQKKLNQCGATDCSSSNAGCSYSTSDCSSPHPSTSNATAPGRTSAAHPPSSSPSSSQPSLPPPPPLSTSLIPPLSAHHLTPSISPPEVQPSPPPSSLIPRSSTPSPSPLTSSSPCSLTPQLSTTSASSPPSHPSPSSTTPQPSSPSSPPTPSSPSPSLPPSQSSHSSPSLRYFHSPILNAKVHRTSLMESLHPILDFCSSHLALHHRILIHDDDDDSAQEHGSSVAVAVALLLACYSPCNAATGQQPKFARKFTVDGNGRVVVCEAVSKHSVRQRLAYVSAWFPQARPTRGLLKQVFNFFECRGTVVVPMQ